MATIQIRDIPDEAYATIRRRAEAAGQSLQAYMRNQVIEMARRTSKEEAFAAIEAALARHGGSSATVDEIVADVHAERR
jgi:antitoxin FitA